MNGGLAKLRLEDKKAKAILECYAKHLLECIATAQTITSNVLQFEAEHK